MKCSGPSKQNINCLDENLLIPGTTVEFNCKSGFINSKKIQTSECLESGEWSKIDEIITHQYQICEYNCKNEVRLENQPLSTQQETNDSIDSPWLVPIYRKNQSTNSLEFICNGNLVRQDIVVTAAHCIDKPLQSNLVVGYKSNHKLTLENVSDENLVAKMETHR